jgi:hypothetical protein
MGTCKECVHWEREANYSRGYCNGNIVVEWSEKYEKEMRDREKKDAILSNRVGIETRFNHKITYGQDFGCIHFKQKEEEKG